MAPSSFTPSEQSFRLGYVTDVEGNLDYFLKFVEHSTVLYESNARLELTDDSCHFVYGGDCVDKGPGDIRLCRLLVDLKERYPDRVELLVGNRDLNKLRLSAELAETGGSLDIPGPHWDPNAPTLKEYLTKLSLEFNEQTLPQLDTRMNRLQYMLRHTLGCPDTFEFRREELRELHEASDISDDQVVESFLHEVNNGSLWKYLNLAKVAVCIGNTLFCHGAVDQRTMKFVPDPNTKFYNPPSPGAGRMVETVNDWVDGLNEYLQLGLADYKQRPHWDDNRSSRGGEALMALQNRSAMWGRSVISNCYGDGGCITTRHAPSLKSENAEITPLSFEGICSNPADPAVSQWLQEHGIQRVVVGHKPTGDCPAVLAATETNVEVLSADTSYSDPSSEDNRGRAVSIVEIVGRSMDDNHLETSGILRDGMQHHSVFSRLSSQDGIVDTTSVGDERLGKMEDDDWWVKARTVHDEYHFTRGRGRKVEYRRGA